MATFLEALADTAVVARACEQAGMGRSGLHALRRRNPFFAAAFNAALLIARERLADTFLERSIEGNVEQIWRDGELVGERRVIDNRLGLAILRRLDRIAETGSALHQRSPASAAPAGSCRSGLVAGPAFDWDRAIAALRTDDPDAIAQAFKVNEVDDPPIQSLAATGAAPFLGAYDRFWWDKDQGCWMTDFPPPAGFAGYELRPFAQDRTSSYNRVCTADEAALLDAEAEEVSDADIADDEALRDSSLEQLRQSLAARGRAPLA